MFRAVFLVMCLLPGVALAAGISAEDQGAIDRAETRGQLIYDLDWAAWVTTDDLKPNESKLPKDIEAGGWVVEQKDGGFRVTYYVVRGGRTGVVYVGNVKDGKVISSAFIERDWPAPTPEQARMIAALETARGERIAKGMNGCTPGAMNSVVIPPASPADPIDVYFLSPLTETEIPAGGHYLIRVSAAGSAILSRAFSKSCLNMDMSQLPKGSTAVVTMNHLLDPTPTEIHIFTSLQARMIIAVLTNSPEPRSWTVNGNRIVPGIAIDPSR